MRSIFNRIEHLRVGRPGSLLTIAQILDWADAYHVDTGRWPWPGSGRIRQSRSGTTWQQIDEALKQGLNGAPGVSLRRLLHERRGVRLRVDEERERALVESSRRGEPQGLSGGVALSVEQILAWADAHHAATGHWPTPTSGPIAGVRGDNWRTIADALLHGRRGLPCGTTLSRLLKEHREARARTRPPTLSLEQILIWADAYQRAHGRWPSELSGPVAGAPGETWRAIAHQLRKGGRGLPGGSSLSRELAKRRGVRNQTSLPDLSIARILAWADAHHAATGKWPMGNSGTVPGAPGETWNTINEALRKGRRGLPGGTSLSRLLDERRKKRGHDLTRQQILTWAEAHRAATGSWPTVNSGAVAGAPGETWLNINQALRYGLRGLPAGSSLSRLFGRAFAGPRPRLTLDQILAWGKTHRAATGRWPRRASGAIAGAPGENWNNIYNAIRQGRRGLPGGISMRQFFLRHNVPAAVKKRRRKPPRPG
jgi:hypothetical protein